MVGDVFWAPYPFTTLIAARPRPVIVVADVREGDEIDWVVCEVTSRSHEHGMAIRLFPDDFQEGSLPRDSWARPNRIFTLNDSLLTDRRGRLTDAKVAEIRAAIHAIFDAGGSAPSELR